MRDLTMGSILIQQHRYSEAYALLTSAQTAFAGAKREQLQAQMRIAICLYAQGDMRGARDQLTEATMQAEKHDYQHLVQIELSRAPDLRLLLETSPTGTAQNSFAQSAGHSSDKKSTGDLPPLPSLSPSDEPGVYRLRILALGEPEVLINDVPVTHWRMARAME